MDIGSAFLLGVLVGQWVLLFVIWQGVAKLLKLIAEQASSARQQIQVLEIRPSQKSN